MSAIVMPRIDFVKLSQQIAIEVQTISDTRVLAVMVILALVLQELTFVKVCENSSK